MLTCVVAFQQHAKACCCVLGRGPLLGFSGCSVHIQVPGVLFLNSDRLALVSLFFGRCSPLAILLLVLLMVGDHTGHFCLFFGVCCCLIGYGFHDGW